MAKPGRNDPCPCGSGKKYKNCHLPLEEAARAEQRRLGQAYDTLMPKLLEAARGVPEAIPAALARYWDGKYTPEHLGELDELEDKGAERFLAWLAFDYALDDGRTLVERLAAGAGTLDLTDDEARLLAGWADVRLRPYVAERVVKGQAIGVVDLLDGTAATVEDRAASRQVAPGEVLIAHLVPAGARHYVAGAAAHLTADTREKLREFAELHLEAYRRDHPAATWADLLRDRSEVLNHFVMALPVEAPDPGVLEHLLLQTRIALKLAGESLGVGRAADERD
jgi:hypothetical protein